MQGRTRGSLERHEVGEGKCFRRAELTMMVMGERSSQPESKFVDQGHESAGRIEPPQESAAKQTVDGRRKIAFCRRDESQKTTSEWVVKKAGGGGGDGLQVSLATGWVAVPVVSLAYGIARRDVDVYS